MVGIIERGTTLKLGEDMVGTAEAARMLNLTQQRVCQLCKSGRLSAERFGSMWLIPADVVRRYGEEHPKFSREGR